MLSTEQMAFRGKGIGGSDASIVMYGDGKAWQALADQKKGLAEPKFSKAQRRLMDMGNAIEPLCLKWFNEDYATLRPIVNPMTLCVEWKVAPLFRCILDGMTLDSKTPVQCKFHVGEKTIDELADYYLPQLQHEIMVTGADQIWLAVVYGRWGQFKAVEVERNSDFIDTYQMRALAFERFWKEGVLPKDMAIPQQVDADIKRLRDHVWEPMDNMVMPLATDWLHAKDAAGTLDDLGKQLKKLFPADARSAKWINGRHGIIMKKNKAGTISLSSI